MKLFLKIVAIFILVLLVALVAFFFLTKSSGPKDPDAIYELRGRYKSSEDGKTYLVIEDDNGGKCGPLYVDQKLWSHGIGAKGEVLPGEHSIECGTWMGVDIKEGTTYFFDYWGP